jgi:4-aminobutyrate aminotransferase-like enzyme
MLTCNFHDASEYHAGPPIKLEYVTDTRGVEPYYRIRFGDMLTIFTTIARLRELGTMIATEIQADRDRRAEADAAADYAIEEQERIYETGAVRCPPRE